MARRTKSPTTAKAPVLEIDNLGNRLWRIHGQYHREDGPAIERPNGTREWWVRGQRHRDDGPAVEWFDGQKEWYLHGRRHRDEGPAVEYTTGSAVWFRHGQRHREDGPAIEWFDGTQEWYFHDRCCTKPAWLREVLKDRPLTTHQRALLDALSENWVGTPDALYETVTHLAE